MKKIFTLVLTLMMVILVNATAEQIDFSAMTIEELEALIADAKTELANRQNNEDNTDASGEVYHFPCVILNTDGYKLEVLSVNRYEYEGSTLITLDVAADNTSEYDIEIDVQFSTMGEWDISDISNSEAVRVKSGKKTKDAMTFYIQNIDATSINDFEFDVSVWDKGRSLYNLYRTETLKGTFE